MKRKLIICSSLITIILSCFSFPIFAEETVQDSSTIHTLSDGVFLDQYFYDNYDPLPYLQSSGTQYINTEINGSSNLRINTVFENIYYGNVFGTSNGSNGAYGLRLYETDGGLVFYYNLNTSYTNAHYPYQLINVEFDRNNIYIDDYSFSFTDSSFNTESPIFIFANRGSSGSAAYYSSIKLYKFSIYDYSLNDGEGGYVRYYYPAKAKTSGTLGLYDAVSKTFFTTGGSSPFVNPNNEYVESFQISSFLTSSLTWIGQIFDAIIQMPIVIIFMAIGLAGAMFRWGRRIVHF